VFFPEVFRLGPVDVHPDEGGHLAQHDADVEVLPALPSLAVNNSGDKVCADCTTGTTTA
jgi:hypothetical protein